MLPASAAEGFSLHGAALLFPELVSFGAHVVDVGEHPGQKGFGRQRIDTSFLKLEDSPLAMLQQAVEVFDRPGLTATKFDLHYELIRVHASQIAAAIAESYEETLKKLRTMLITHAEEWRAFLSAHGGRYGRSE
jgi:hypothetical protein